MTASPETLGKAAELIGAGGALACGACRWVATNHDFLSGVGIIVGVLIGIAGFLVSTYYSRLESKRRDIEIARREPLPDLGKKS